MLCCLYVKLLLYALFLTFYMTMFLKDVTDKNDNFSKLILEKSQSFVR